MPDIKVPKRVVIAPYWLLNDYFTALLGSSTDNAIVRFDGTSGQIQDSGVLVSDTDTILTANGTAAACGVGFGVADTGFHRPFSPTLHLSINGTDLVRFHETDGIEIFTGQLTLPSTGTVEAGSILYLEGGGDGGAAAVRSETVRDSTTAAAANVFINATSGSVQRSTSARKYKRKFTRLTDERVALFLRLIGGTYYSLCKGDDPDEMFSGVLADQADALGLTDLVTYNEDGEPEGFRYERGIAYFLEAFRSLDARVSALETKT